MTTHTASAFTSGSSFLAKVLEVCLQRTPQGPKLWNGVHLACLSRVVVQDVKWNPATHCGSCAEQTAKGLRVGMDGKPSWHGLCISLLSWERMLRLFGQVAAGLLNEKRG